MICLNSFAESGGTQNDVASISRELQPESGKLNLPSHLSIGVLQEIGKRCGSKVHYIRCKVICTYA